MGFLNGFRDISGRIPDDSGWPCVWTAISNARRLDVFGGIDPDRA